MIHVVHHVTRNNAHKVLIITGAGEAFSSGADLATETPVTSLEPPSLAREIKLEPFVRLGYLVKLLYELNKPVIAAVNGVAAGGGLSLALAADVRVAARNARFSAIFAKRGLVPDTGTLFFLPRLVGMEWALQMMWFGEMVDAEEARRIGLVSHLVDEGKALERAEEIARRLAESPSVVIEATKKASRLGAETASLDAVMAAEGYLQNLAFTTSDFKEGVQAFLEKRKAVFRGE
jgi:2-(1,2-epoxy-1,2-dihydrophenyl)acetyl-CoA isomerase